MIVVRISLGVQQTKDGKIVEEVGDHGSQLFLS